MRPDRLPLRLGRGSLEANEVLFNGARGTRMLPRRPGVGLGIFWGTGKGRCLNLYCLLTFVAYGGRAGHGEGSGAIELMNITTRSAVSVLGAHAKFRRTSKRGSRLTPKRCCRAALLDGST